MADTFTFSFSGFEYSGSGTFTTSAGSPGPAGSTKFDITGITGSVKPILGPSSSISSLSAFGGADNELFDPGIFGIYNLDSDGVSFQLANGNKVNLSAGVFTYYADTNLRGTVETIDFSIRKSSGPSDPPPAVPEPASIALLGTGVLGAAGAIRRRFKA